MLSLVLADDVLTQLWTGIFSWEFLQFIVALASILGFVMTSALILILLERKVMAWMQDRLGPIHTGPWGLLQTVADAFKLLLKEDIHTTKSDKIVFLLAPAIFMAPVFAAFAVLPFSPYVGLPGTALATGIIYVVAMSSIDVVGVIMAGWGSNNKYALMGGLRSAAQMISYELPLVLALISVIMLTSVLTGLPGYPAGQDGIGSISFKQIMDYQNIWAKTGNGVLDFIFEGFTPWLWFFLIQPLMLIVYYTCSLAETNRAPFDLPEAESELVAGYLTEYSGIRWAMFFLGEYGNMTVASAITCYLFLGGWSGPGVAFLTALNVPIWGLVGNLLALFYFIGKIYLLCVVFIWVRSTLPRLRADQLMQFAWLILIPVTLANIIITGGVFLAIESAGWPAWVFLVTVGVLNWIGLFGFIMMISRVTKSSTKRARKPALQARQRAAAAAEAINTVPTRVALPKTSTQSE